MFGPWPCRWSEVFYLSASSLAMVNLKPLVPGHSLVIPRRVTARFTELSADEASDLWLSAQAIGRKLEQQYNSSALTFAIQDGADAGQSVPHVHIHVLPRRSGDFPSNDQVYDELDKQKLNRGVDAEDDRKPRSKDEMAAEAASLRPLFVDESIAIPADGQEAAEDQQQEETAKQ